MVRKYIDDTLIRVVQANYWKHRLNDIRARREHKEYIINDVIPVVISLILMFSFGVLIIYNLFFNNANINEIQGSTGIVNQVNNLTFEEYNYLARCVMAEAGDQDEYGQRLVIDVVLNRAELYNMSVIDIINEPNQFAVVRNGSINNIPDVGIYTLIERELDNRTNTDVFYFRTEHYHLFGVPMFQHQDHYFSRRAD